MLPGNKEFVPGDEIKKPRAGDGAGRGKDAADSGEGEDDFEFTMTQDEILDIFFEDLELPNLVRTTLKETPSKTWRRAGITTSGSPNQINLIRTMRNSLGPPAGAAPAEARATSRRWKRRSTSPSARIR